jgi:hypothetical protein
MFAIPDGAKAIQGSKRATEHMLFPWGYAWLRNNRVFTQNRRPLSPEKMSRRRRVDAHSRSTTRYLPVSR